tara:strand:- start:288 stop:557 length:270 start_codon:yes stop_codon:yes gene_type:complete
MKDAITIEKNVPMPPMRGAGQRQKYSFIETMEVSDSFMVDNATPNFTPDVVRKYVYNLNSRKHYRKRYSVRTIAGGAINPTAIRVWRIQ